MADGAEAWLLERAGCAAVTGGFCGAAGLEVATGALAVLPAPAFVAVPVLLLPLAPLVTFDAALAGLSGAAVPGADFAAGALASTAALDGDAGTAAA